MLTITEAIAVAFQSYQTGNLSHAQLVCNQILQQQPDNVEALHLLGIIAYQLGNLNDAIAYYQQLTTLMPDYAEVYYSLGAAWHASGQLTEAIANYQQALTLKPDYSEALYDLGSAFQEQGNLQAAIENYQASLVINPNDAEAHGNLANALLQQGQIEEAIAHYHKVIALKPHVPGVYYNLGNALRQQGQLDAAITHFRWAIALDPNYTDAYLQLALSLHSSGQLEQAIFYYQQAIVLNPNLTDAYYSLGNILQQQGRYREAITPYRKALELKPDFISAYAGLSCALIGEFQLEEAIDCLQQALILAPNHPEACHNLGAALMNQSKPEEAIGYFQKALQFKPDLAETQWHYQLILPIVYDSQQQIPHWRQRFCEGLNILIQQADLDTPAGKTQALAGLEKGAYTFYLGYQGLNDRGLQSKYGKFVHQVMAASYPHWTQPLPMPPLSHTGKIRVGYLSAHFRGHTVAMLTLGWLKNCDKQNFEIYVYHIGYQTDVITEQFRACSDGFHHSYGSLKTVSDQILADNLHILVFTDIGMDAWTTLVAGLRLAPVQCMSWGHPVTSGLPTVDYFLSSELMEPENAQAHYCEKLIRLPNIGICYEKPLLSKPTKTREDFQLREDAVVYLSCQSLFKYLPQFDLIFAQIAKVVPQAQFAFISSHSPTITTQFQARLQRTFTQLGLRYEDYCVFVPRLERADYFNLNLVSNIYLDTLSWSGGNTTLEAVACGLPIVTCPGEFMRSRHSYGILQMLGVTETIATHEAEYVEIAVRLGLDAQWRQEIVRKMSERHSRLYEDKTCVTVLESFYKQVVHS